MSGEALVLAADFAIVVGLMGILARATVMRSSGPPVLVSTAIIALGLLLIATDRAPRLIADPFYVVGMFGILATGIVFGWREAGSWARKM